MSRADNAEVQYALVQNFSRQAPINVTITTLAILWTTWLLAPKVSPVLLWPWVVIHLSLVGVLFVRWYRRARAVKLNLPRPASTRSISERAKFGRMRAIQSAFVSGCLWGATVLFIVDLPDEYKAAMVIIVAALAGGATTTLSAIPVAAGVYALTSILPFSVYFFLRGPDPVSVTIGSLAAIMAGAMVWASRSVHGTFLDDIAARVEATTALEDLRTARDDWLQVAQSADAFALFNSEQRLKFRNQAFVNVLAGPDRRAGPGELMIDLAQRLVASEEVSMGLVTIAERQQRYMHLLENSEEPLVERLADGRWMRSTIRATQHSGFLWVMQDITTERSRENTEIKLRARLAEAKQLQTIGQFAGGVAHDFNNVLGAIHAFGTFIVQQATPPDVQNAAKRIVNACERGAGMVRNILQLATASRVDKEPFVFAGAFQQAMTLLLARTPEHAEFVPEDKTSGAFIEANESQVVQLIMNLVVNGFAALRRGQGRVSLRASVVDVDTATATQFFDAASGLDGVTELPDGSNQFVFGMLLPNKTYVKITVEDNGSGIESVFLPRIFDPFVSTKEATLRTGFGLAVVRSVVLVSEGALCVRSAVGRGTTFDVYIAVVQPADSVSAPPVTAVQTRSSAVMIVDDDADVADGLYLVLKTLGHAPKAFYDPRAALKAYAEKPSAWPIVIADVSMPGMMGDELATELRELNPRARVILYTGRVTDDLRAIAARIGGESVLQKPIDPMALANIIGGMP